MKDKKVCFSRTQNKGFAHILILIAVAGVIIFVGAVLLTDFRNNSSKSKSEPSQVTWQLREGKVWKATGSPPACPDPLVLTPPVDISKVSGILYPGQPRGDAFKPHGAFRFDNQNNEAIVKVPFDAQVVRGSRAFRNGENQYAFEFIAPCGIWYSLGHLLELTPKFLDIANKLPLIGDFAEQQFFDINPAIFVKTGEIIATKVGYAKTNNVFVDFGVLDLRYKNGDTIRPEWKALYGNQFDEYAVCWLELLPAFDRDHLRGLFGSGDSVTGTKSDYCHYPENK